MVRACLAVRSKGLTGSEGVEGKEREGLNGARPWKKNTCCWLGLYVYACTHLLPYVIFTIKNMIICSSNIRYFKQIAQTN